MNLVPAQRYYADDSSRDTFDPEILTREREIESLHAMKRLRTIIWSLYYKYFRTSESLLDLSCGTGIDAMELASNGMYILATDPSAEMIAVLKKKIDRTALRSFIHPLHLSFHKLGHLDGQRFDGAYSNLGALNSTRRLELIARDLARIIKPGKYVILSLMPTFCLWETFSFLLQGKWNDAFRRRSADGVLAKVRGERIWVRYLAPNHVRHVFGPYFEFVELKGVNVFSPPPSAKTAYRFLSKAITILEKLDDWLPINSRFHGYGDQYVIVFRRKG